MAKEAKPRGVKTKIDSTRSPNKMKVAAKLKIPSPPTSPEVSPSPSPVPDEVVDEMPAVAEIEKIDSDSPDWPKDDDMELFERIKKSLPADDSMKYESRLNHIDWESVAFGVYSGEDCRKRWHYVQAHLRRYRLLNEMVVDAMSWRLRPWTNFNASRKAQNHPEHPKKPLSAYLIFYMEKKNEVMSAQPGLAMTELSKLIAKMYSSLNEKKKSKYAELAKKEKELYEIKLKKFLEDHPDYIPLKSSAAQAKAVAPKMPTPYKLYCDAMMSKFVQEGLHNLEARHKCLETFKELSDRNRLKWIYQSLEQESQYLEDVEKFKQEHPEVVIVKKSLLSKEEQALKDKTEGKPAKPPNSGYSLFSQKLLASDSLKNFESKDRMAEISRQWKELDEDNKNNYKQEALQLMHVYKMKYASYLESLQPEQREAELIRTSSKSSKRGNNQLKQKDQPEEKKSKLEKESNSSDNGESDSSEKDFQLPKPSKTKSIQKPNSSLQMFCNANMDKYRKKHSELSQLELARLLAKAFSKLSTEEKHIYEIMAMRSKEDSSAPAKKDKKTKKDPAKEPPPPPEADKKSNVKAKVKTSKTPSWAADQQLYKNEPPRPPQNVAKYFAYMKGNDGTQSQAALEERWEKLSTKEKDKYIQMHQKEMKDYVIKFETFIRTLPNGELKPFRDFMSERDRKKKEEEEQEEEEEAEEEASDVEDDCDQKEAEEEEEDDDDDVGVRLELEAKSSSGEESSEESSGSDD